jgi:uroporphyrinogen decarboxylase
MTRRERVIAAIRHQETDPVPYDVDLTIPARARLIEYVGDPGYIEKIGNHIKSVKYGGRKEFKPGYARDHFGVIWNQTADKDIGVIDNYLIAEPSLAGFEFPLLDEKAWRELLENAIANAGDCYLMVSVGFSMFERAWSLRGMENTLVDMIAEPEFVDEFLDAICEFQCKIIDIALEYPVDGMHFGDDWGQQKGQIMGPDHWRRFIKPRVARMYAKTKAAGKFVSQHSCGDIQALFPDLIEIGLDVYQTFQPEIYDVAAVKREFGKDLTFWGGISTQRALPFLTPDQIKQYTRDMISVMSPGGGYICAPTHQIPGDVPPENIVAMVEVMQRG